MTTFTGFVIGEGIDVRGTNPSVNLIRYPTEDAWRIYSDNSNNLYFSTSGQTGSIYMSSPLYLNTGSGNSFYVNFDTSALTQNYSIPLPATPPLTNQTFLFNGTSSASWTNFYNNIQNQLIVSKNPTPNQFNSLLSAVASIPTGVSAPGPTSQWAISIYPGYYSELSTITLPSYVNVIGLDQNSPIFSTSGNTYPLFDMQPNSSVSTITIQDIGVSAPSVIANNCRIEKVDFNNCSKGIYINPGTTSSCYFEHLYFTRMSEYCINVQGSSYQNSVNIKDTCCQLENGLNCLILNGSYVDAIVNTGVFTGTTGTCISVNGGAEINANAIYMDGWNIAIDVPSDSFSPTLLLGGCLFDNNTTNLNISNQNTTGNYDGNSDYLKTVINPLSSFYIKGKDPNIINVAKKGGDFTSVSSAISSITTNSSINPYIVYVGPGIYVEPVITMKPYVSVIGFYQANCILTCLSSGSFITMAPNSNLSNLTLNGINSTGNKLIEYQGSTIASHIEVRNISLGSSETLINLDSSLGNNISIIQNIIISNISSFNYAVKYSDTVSLNILSSIIDDVTWNPISFAAGCTTIFHAKSLNGGTIPTLSPVLSNIKMGQIGLTPQTTCIELEGLQNFNLYSSIFQGFNKGIYIPNTTVKGPQVKIGGVILYLNNTDIQIENPNTFGDINSTASIANSTFTTGITALNVVIHDSMTGALSVSGSILQGNSQDFVTNISQHIQYSSNLGVISGGSASGFSGLYFNISSGEGYLTITGSTITSDYLKYITWQNSGITVPDSSYNYIYVNSSGSFQYSSSLPNYKTSILIGAAKTGTTSLEFFEQIPKTAYHPFSQIDSSIRSGFGPIVTSGLLVTAGSTQLRINVSSGDYWYSNIQYSPSSIANATMKGYYQGITSGTWINTTLSQVPTLWNNAGGSLAGISPAFLLTPASWIKHGIYNVGDGAYQTTLLVYGQQQFSSSINAVNGALPTPPSFFNENVVPICGVILTNGDVSWTGTTGRFQDIRPTLTFQPVTTSAITSDHNSLLNLTTGDAHCFSSDTEILTKNGFLNYLEINSQTEVLTLNMEKNEYEFQKILQKFEYSHFTELVKLKTENGSILVTRDHNIIQRDYSAEKNISYKINTAESLLGEKDIIRIPTKISKKVKNILEKNERLLQFLFIQGTLFPENVNLSNLNSDQYYYLEKMTNQLNSEEEKLFKKEKIEEFFINNSEEYEKIIENNSKKFEDFFENNFEIFLKGVLFSIGFPIQYIEKLNFYDFIIPNNSFSDEKKFFLEKNLLLNGFSVINKKEGLFFSKIKEFEEIINSKIIPYSGNVWCVSVPNKSVVVRRKGLIFICGNTQYFRTDGTRIMTGNVDCGNNTIINNSSINGVTVQAHGNRHLPGGADPLTTSIPVTIGTTNFAGSANSYILSDHIHSHGSQTDPTMHALAGISTSGFMGTTHFNQLLNSTPNSTLSTLVLRNATGSANFYSIGLDNIGRTATVSLLVNPGITTCSYLIPNPGTSGQVLTNLGITNSNSSILSWSSISTMINDPMTTRGDIIYRDGTNTTSRLGKGSFGNYLKSGATTLYWDYGNLQEDTCIQFDDDFLYSTTTLNNVWTSVATGAGSNTDVLSSGLSFPPQHHGVACLRGTANPSVAALTLPIEGFYFGSGPVAFKSSICLARAGVTTTNLIRTRVGFGSSTNSVEHTAGVYFDLNEGATNVWRVAASKGNSFTIAATGITITPGVWTSLAFTIDSTASNATFFINGATVANITSNIPNDVANSVMPGVIFNKVLGAVNRVVGCDYIAYNYRFGDTAGSRYV